MIEKKSEDSPKVNLELNELELEVYTNITILGRSVKETAFYLKKSKSTIYRILNSMTKKIKNGI